MPFDCFLQIADIEGESTDEKHPNWIELHSYSFGASQAIGTSVSTGGARSGQRVDLQDFSISKDLDKASPKIFLCCCNGTHIPKITMQVHRATAEKQLFFQVDMEDILVTNYQPAGQAGGQIPSESVTFNPAKITVTYTTTDHDTGKPGGQVAAWWDQALNTGG